MRYPEPTRMRLFLAYSMLLGAILGAGCGPRGAPPLQVLEPVEIVVTGTNYRWHVRNPGVDGALETKDDIHAVQEVRVPLGANVRVELRSLDFLYTFSVPEQNLREIAVPDLSFTLEFNLPQQGEYELKCEQICGILEPMVLGSLIAMSREDYANWLRSADE